MLARKCPKPLPLAQLEEAEAVVEEVAVVEPHPLCQTPMQISRNA